MKLFAPLALALSLLAGCSSTDERVEIDTSLDNVLIIQNPQDLQLAYTTLELPPRNDPRGWLMTPEEFKAFMAKARETARKRCLRQVYGTDDPMVLASAIRSGEWGADSVEALMAFAACMKAAGFPLNEFVLR